MKTYGFIGLGLIGGSIARAIRETQEDARIIAHDVNQESLRLALSDGVANEITDAIDDRFSACDYLFYMLVCQRIVNFFTVAPCFYKVGNPQHL